jgi:hypothetical protein
MAGAPHSEIYAALPTFNVMLERPVRVNQFCESAVASQSVADTRPDHLSLTM